MSEKNALYTKTSCICKTYLQCIMPKNDDFIFNQIQYINHGHVRTQSISNPQSLPSISINDAKPL